MKTTMDYSKSVAPNFDAVNDIMDYFGERYVSIARGMSLIKDRETFEAFCELGGVYGFQIQAWYDHFHGQGAWERSAK